jgi:hypothetical protein
MKKLAMTLVALFAFSGVAFAAGDAPAAAGKAKPTAVVKKSKKSSKHGLKKTQNAATPAATDAPAAKSN